LLLQLLLLIIANGCWLWNVQSVPFSLGTTSYISLNPKFLTECLKLKRCSTNELDHSWYKKNHWLTV
jgi:hypothetical protein